MRKVKVIEPKKQEEQEQKKKPKVCAYARVSTGTDEQANSYDNQKKYWEDKLNKPEYEFIGIFADKAISGTTDKRPEFQRMIKMALQGEIDTIWTKNISRFSRNVFDLLKYTKMLEEAGVNVIFDETRIAGDEQGLSLRSANGKIMLLVLASVAEMEVQNTSDHIKHTLHAKMSRGELVGQPNPFGYDRNGNELTINEEEAEWVKFIFEQYNNGLGGRAIARLLTEKGVPTRRGGKVWSDSVVLGIIKNEKYTGKLVQGKTITVNPIGRVRKDNENISNKYEADDAVPAIIDLETWEKAQEILKNRIDNYKPGVKKGQRKGSHHYAFSDLMYCTYCGGKLARRSLTYGGESVPIWQCQTYTKKGKQFCPKSKFIRESVLEQAFVNSLNNLLSEKPNGVSLNVKELKKAIKEQNKSVSEYEKEITKINKKLNLVNNKKHKLLDLLMDEAIDEETYRNKNEEFEQSVQTLRAEIEGLEEKRDNAKSTTQEQEEIIKLITEEDVSAFNEKILRALVDCIDIGDVITGDPHAIMFYYKESALITPSWMIPAEEYEGEWKGAETTFVEPEDTVVPTPDTTHVECVVGMTKGDIQIGDTFAVSDNSMRWETDEKGNRIYSVNEPYTCQNRISRLRRHIPSNDNME